MQKYKTEILTKVLLALGVPKKENSWEDPHFIHWVMKQAAKLPAAQASSFYLVFGCETYKSASDEINKRNGTEIGELAVRRACDRAKKKLLVTVSEETSLVDDARPWEMSSND